MQFGNFSESFCKKSGSFCSNSETSYEFGFYSKKNANDTGDKQNAVLKNNGGDFE